MGAAPETDKVRTTLWLTAGQTQALKHRAIDRGTTFSELVREAVELADAHDWQLPEATRVTERIGSRVVRR